MSTERQGTALIGAGAAACAVCCAGPIAGVLSAIGLGTLGGVLTFGGIALAVGAAAAAFVVVRRRRRVRAGTSRALTAPEPVSVEMGARR